MSRHGEEDRQALEHIVALLLSLAALELAAGTLPASRRFVLLAVLRHAAAVACAFAGTIHAPVNGRSWRAPAPGDDEAVQLSGVLRALARALAVLARHGMHATHWLAVRACPLPRRAAVMSGAVTPRPRAPDTS